MAIHDVTVDELAEPLAGEARRVDVREPWEHHEPHLPSAAGGTDAWLASGRDVACGDA